MQGGMGRYQLQWCVVPRYGSTGILVNCALVCKTDQACAGFPPGVPPPGGGGKVPRDMVCYKGGETVFSIHQMCNVTSACGPVSSVDFT
jgi:hypothetical protein